MSVYIKGMEMPTSCYGCPFFKQVDYWNKNDEADIMSKCKRTGEFTWKSVKSYLPNCPLIPVPEHGDLIDRDALLNNKGVGTQIAGWGKMYHETVLEYAPPIIPADPADKEGEP